MKLKQVAQLLLRQLALLTCYRQTLRIYRQTAA